MPTSAPKFGANQGRKDFDVLSSEIFETRAKLAAFGLLVDMCRAGTERQW
jgi:hypothetical protein